MGSCAPVCVGDVVFQILEADAPQAAAADLDGAQLSAADQPADEARLHVELFGCLLDSQEAALYRFIGHSTIVLCVRAGGATPPVKSWSPSSVLCPIGINVSRSATNQVPRTLRSLS